MELDAILDNLSDEEQIELLELLEEEENYRNTHLLYEFTPYSKQREFIDAGHDYPERCFMAGNQLGKSFTGAAEVAFHLTGRYANKQLVMMGLKKPETPEEMEMVQQAQQQPQQPSAEQIQAQGILLQGQAELLKAENQQAQIQVEAAKVEAQNQLNAAKIAEIFNNMDLDKQAELREYLKLVGQFQQQRSKDARANAELLLKDADQTHSQRMDFANLMRQVQIPSGGVAETPQ